MHRTSIFLFLITFAPLIVLSSSDDTSIPIAAIFSKSGKAQHDSLPYLNAVRIAVDQINSSGGILGRKFRLLEIDNKSTALESRRAAEHAVSLKVVAVIGGSFSSHAMAMAPVLERAGVVMISPTSTHPSLTMIGDYIFRVCFTDTYQGDVMATFARQDLNAGTAIILTNADSLYSMELARRFTARFHSMDGTVLMEGDYIENTSDFSSLLEKIFPRSPDVIFIPGYSTDAGLIVSQARKMGIASTFIGGDGWDRRMYDFCGAAMNDSYFVTHWHPDNGNVKSLQFVRDYESEYGQMGDYSTALAYDATMILADAIERAKSTDPPRIREALAATGNFNGITGSISFDKNGDPIKPLIINKMMDGKITFIKAVMP